MRDGVKRHKRYNLNWFSEDKELLLLVLNYCYFSTKEEKEKKLRKIRSRNRNKIKIMWSGSREFGVCFFCFLSLSPSSFPLEEYTTPFLAAWEFFVVLCSSIELFSLCFSFGCQYRMRLVTGKDRQTKSDKRKRESKRWNWEIKLWLHI